MWKVLFARVDEEIRPVFMWQLYLLKSWRVSYYVTDTGRHIKYGKFLPISEPCFCFLLWLTMVPRETWKNKEYYGLFESGLKLFVKSPETFRAGKEILETEICLFWKNDLWTYFEDQKKDNCKVETSFLWRYKASYDTRNTGVICIETMDVLFTEAWYGPGSKWLVLFFV